jgi:hypothetical protein
MTLIVGMLARRADVLDAAEARLVEVYGPVELRSSPILFVWTDYYAGQMGAELLRRFVSFRDRVDPGRLAAIKLHTTELERELEPLDAEVARPVNLDPGLLSGGKLVLATAKDRAHRIYLSDGIYAEVTLVFEGGRFRPVETTYPDYRSAAYAQFFKAAREHHLRKEQTAFFDADAT